MRNLKLFTIIGLTAFALFSFTVLVQSKPWEVPAKYKSMKNPTDAKDKEGANEGKALFAKQCSSCHGKKGLGDGSKAADLKGDMGDFSSAKSQKQTDGEMFYRMTEGRDDMPSFKKKIPNDEDRWLVVNYVRTLKK
ncbi:MULTISPECIES: c-type cytochrome [unclassified Flavobacterium]|jgi:mono/diheme cytochrome c family protein|uniref:c-type cytochrome n=1 Tax=unclassified Flavobacterium TaxID=196869 RepID=UPI0025BBE937|nr:MULTISPECIES: cytochrome c [unclassified Flavobacterium]